MSRADGADVHGDGSRHEADGPPQRRLAIEWRSRIAIVSAAAVATVLASLLATAPAHADSKQTDPSDPKTPVTVSADALDAPQIDGVVWDQVVVGNTVYVGGRFTTARPAGSPAGKNTVPRSNILAYDLRTGALLPFAPALDAQVNALAVSADKKTLYVGGSFTKVTPPGLAAVARTRLASFDVATGALVSSFAPVLNSSVTTLAASATSVFAGGWFTSAQKTQRTRLAAFHPTTAALQSWAPIPAGGDPRALVVSPDGSKVVVGGDFTSLNGSSEPGFGVGAVRADTGASLPWAVNSIIRNGGQGAAVYSLSSDATSVYATAYSYYAVEQSPYTEGTYAARWTDGELLWHEDCHGDTYSSAPAGDVVYTAGHAHDCERVGGFASFTKSASSSDGYHRALAFSNAATGELKPYVGDLYTDFEGQPSPSLLDWYPYFDVGSATGQWQGPWDVTVAGDYVLYAGEFTRVSGKAQQGLVRFRAPDAAPNRRGPELSGAVMAPTIEQLGVGSVRLAWPANYDPDNATLRYEVYRSGVAAPIATLSEESRFWDRPTLSIVDSGLTPGTSYSYTVKTIDPFGNATTGSAVAVTPTGEGSTTLTAYDRTILGDSPASYWPLNETLGTRAIDHAGRNDAVLAATVSRKTAGVESLAGGYSSTFPGSIVGGIARERSNVPFVATAELWFSSTASGRLLDIADQPQSAATGYDLSLELRPDGRLGFATTANSAIASAEAFNDGAWHHVVATAGPAGTALTVDGVLRASDPRSASTRPIIAGSWRFANGFDGRLDDVAVYDRVLSHATIVEHADSGRAPQDAPPVAAFDHREDALSVAVDGSASTDDGGIAAWAWDFGDGANGSGRTASHAYSAAGTYTITLTVRDAAGQTATSSARVAVEGPAAPDPTLALDVFERAVAGSWGTADRGGAWSTVDGTSGYSVANGAGTLTLAKGEQRTSLLPNVSSNATDSTATFAIAQASSGGGQYLSLIGRSIGSSSYSGRVWIQGNGVPQLQLRRGGDVLKAVNLAGSYSPGGLITVRLSVTGTGTTTVQAKAWIGSASEPGAWQLSATDATAALQAAGSVGVQGYLSGTATTATTISLQQYSVTRATP